MCVSLSQLVASQQQHLCLLSHFPKRPWGEDIARKARKLYSSLYIYYSVCQHAPFAMFSILLLVIPQLSKAAEERMAL